MFAFLYLSEAFCVGGHCATSERIIFYYFGTCSWLSVEHSAMSEEEGRAGGGLGWTMFETCMIELDYICLIAP